ncbi:ABC transporter substrate-binding protein [Mycolicibacterium chitae]|uniref:Periplasmic solute binding protein n=1 Tax=Mycolicibacterium chitae TaxID=1792 RepID=A0A448I718_MYCCI|nr:zinc ABC transporter substrate-binding protein AztC [Mycolicibacterium chitae]MCV7108094.1 zinc ABC transporter substrate-binding protein [Mycolicibacterium chitae]BBZ04501.1 ABC transporter substrate-binding protein [Mycolicibacterium chitae]VEG48133.1 periplasmic solute binding protein [Mycolicibacterium chitae]
MTAVRIWIFALLGLLVIGCGGAGTTGPGGGEIVVTTNILGDVVRNVVGDTATVRVLMQAGADPHSFGVSAQDAAAMSGAQLILHNGLGLEENIARNIESAASQGVPTLGVGDRIDSIAYSDGDSAGTPDPHFWTDPQRMVAVVDAVEEMIVGEIDGIDTVAVSRNADEYRRQLRELDAEMAQAFGAIPPDRRKLVTNHHVLGYLAQRFDFTVIGAVVPSGTTLAAPSASDLQSLADAIDSARVPAIFVDSSQPEKLARVLAEQAGVEVQIVPLYSESLSPPGTPGATYLDMMRANTGAIVTGLR